MSGPVADGSDGVLRAATADGSLLPILDVTHPRFAMDDTPEGYAALLKALDEHQRRFEWMPRWLLAWLLRREVKRSKLMEAVFGEGSAGGYLDAITTYVMKLGPDNLAPPYDGPADRRFAAAPQAAFIRLRTQQMATLIADAVRRESAVAGRSAPLDLVDIAGGPALDAMNALILIARSSPALLARPVRILVLDRDAPGPTFGRNALAELMRAGALKGLDIAFSHITYDWSDVAPLRHLVAESRAAGAVLVAASEGGLFEYGSDDAIVANLIALNGEGRGASAVIGSVTRSAADRGRALTGNAIRVIPRGLAAFAPLAAAGGFEIAASRPAFWSDQVELRPRSGGSTDPVRT